MLFAMSRNMTMHELKQLNRVVYKQNRFSGYVPADQEDAINSADNDAEGPDLFGEPRDHLYKVTEQRIDGQSASSDDESGGSSGRSQDQDIENRMQKYHYHRINAKYGCFQSIMNIFKFAIFGPRIQNKVGKNAPATK